MNQRVVKPAFWPVMICSSVFLTKMMYFLIGGMLNNRFEDTLIAALAGFVLFLAIIFVKNNAYEIPKMALFLTIFWPVVAVLSLILMWNNLAEIDGSIGQVFTYLGEMWRIFWADFEAVRNNAANAREVARNAGNPQPFATTIRAAFMSGRVFAGIPRDTERMFFLSAGIISAVLFLIAQAATFVLLFVGTVPEKKDFRH
ncbi:MAG: hypothetical protein FWB80_01060 [Defluviitaleaceae bacterium]|nr:hypothetical protein [Defluviitaleaceae bacterium]